MNLGRKIPLHNNGTPIRNWLHADDTARAVVTVINSGTTNEIYNISGNAEMPNREVIQKILKYYKGADAAEHWEDYIFESSRVGQDVRYAIDDSKLKALGWQPQAEFDKALEEIVKYYTINFIW